MKRIDTVRGSFNLLYEDQPAVTSLFVFDLLQAITLAIKEQDPAKAQKFYDFLTYSLLSEGKRWIA